MNEYIWSINEEHHGTRVDKLLTEFSHEWSRTIIQAWINEGYIKVNGTKIKSNYKVNTGDTITVIPKAAEEAEIEPENIPLSVVYEDRDIIVVNKSRGMVVHPAPGHASGTLVNALLYHCNDLSGINGEKRPGIVHRIDKDTSGLIVAAKHNKAHEKLSEQLQDKSMQRMYYALVHGDIPHEYGTIDAPIGRDPKDRQKMTVTDKNAKPAVTHFSVLERFENYTYLKCELETGRTHQIRVHLQYIGHPVAGDPKYGRKNTLPISGQALHAFKLSLIHPANEAIMEFDAPLPDDMAGVLRDLRNKS
ncbi:RluA family pseudouridine synthase [Alteribacillus sp. HJP-4]|uniref:RluA family pseudouridine synthase n=1 Tax=Alteribacillus sp. HJP-4 TaxID=2775394 RepID=UPI0035CCF18A